MKTVFLFVLVLISLGCRGHADPAFVLILGVAQDGGYPHIGCFKACCLPALTNHDLKKFAVSFALVDPVAKKWWLFEATPDIKEQLQYFKAQTHSEYAYLPDGIFITHAHIGHYTGLMQLGFEAMNTKGVGVYVLPKMSKFLRINGPWSQLVTLKNIEIRTLTTNALLKISDNVEVSAFTVPHRNEFSETAGFHIKTSAKTYLFIPDIDKWEKWDKDIRKEVEQVDVALLDATFSSAMELPGREIKEVPHPFVRETVELFHNKDIKARERIFFIHFNHTNPLLWDVEEQKPIQKKAFNVASQGMRL